MKIKNEITYRIKGYLVFTSLFYRIVMFVLIPAVMAGFAVWAGRRFGNMATVLTAILLPMVEIVSDNWLFGGIQTKDAEKLDYLKTSSHGMNVMRNALWTDLFRKFLMVVIVQGISYLAWKGRVGEYGILMGMEGNSKVLQMIYGMAVSWCFAVLGTFIARYGNLLWSNVMISYIAVVLESLCWFVLSVSKHGTVYVFLYVAVGILAGILSVKTAMNRVEGSYYDN